jgi:hypothetical protein
MLQRYMSGEHACSVFLLRRLALAGKSRGTLELKALGVLLADAADCRTPGAEVRIGIGMLRDGVSGDSGVSTSVGPGERSDGVAWCACMCSTDGDSGSSSISRASACRSGVDAVCESCSDAGASGVVRGVRGAAVHMHAPPAPLGEPSAAGGSHRPQCMHVHRTMRMMSVNTAAPPGLRTRLISFSKCSWFFAWQKASWLHTRSKLVVHSAGSPALKLPLRHSIRSSSPSSRARCRLCLFWFSPRL